MYLKQIEIVGFKSFADKSKIVLAPGVTGVVGPNGSGKSNIADAVRWVLGEQSARNLRGNRMEDVIFAGSDGRRATNLCEVSLILDNEDGHLPVVFDEVTVTRRVFRSGDSEYMINRQPCRLRDIHELFMDSGLGREAYSIIGQGKIEEMLSTRPEDRRGPFEDAAGIVKFKHRRREAERRLDETNANLLRVEDILAELEEQVGPLLQEKERALRYRELAESLEQAEISLLIVEIDKLNNRFRIATESVESRQQAREAAEQELQQAQELWQKERHALDVLSQQVDEIQERYVSFVEERQRVQGELALMQQELEYVRETEATKLRQHEENTHELERTQEQISHVGDTIQQIESSLELKSGELEVATAHVAEQHREVLTSQLEDLNAEYIQLNHQSATLRNELKMLHEQAESEETKRAKYTRDAKQLAARMDALDEEQRDCDSELLAVREQMAKLAESVRQHDAAFEAAGVEESEIVSQLHRVQADRQSQSSRLDLLRDLEDGYDGYAVGVRTVMQQAKSKKIDGIFGTIAELIRVDKRFETAIETTLGGALQNVVVDRETSARTAIQMLKKRQAGRATFMPLDVIQPRRLRESELNRVSNIDGFLGLASDLIDVDAAFSGAIENLLGNVVIASTLETASRLAKELQYRVRIVTLDGDVVSPGGLMSGGHHQRKGPGLLGRSRERTDLERQLAQLSEQESALEEHRLASRSRATAAQQARNEAQSQLEVAMSRRQELSSKVGEIAYSKKTTEERLSALEWEFHQLVSGTDVFLKRQQDASSALSEATRRLAEIEQKIQDKRAELAMFEEEFAKRQDSVTSLRIEVATMRQERSSVQHRLNELSERQRKLREAAQAWAQEAEGFEQRRENLSASLDATTQKVEDCISAVESSEAQLDTARQARLEREVQARQSEEVVTEARKALADAEDLLHRAQVSSERVDAELAYALEKMGETHGMTYEWAKSHHPSTMSPDELNRQASKLRQEVEALGDVNVGAIEEHARLSERIAFLTNQRDDLVTARAELNDLIGEIDTEMATRFNETFAKVREAFAQEFEVLFGGGEANLHLTNPDDPLTTGIDVAAKPPGKRLQNLNLLSGGERALTAMALLFAILQVRPVPFCVLDEVEAALDEANVGRFAMQLRRLAGDTQFIVITHRRGTMEEVDALYGVTMPERGVSSLVSVRLSEDENFETA